MYYRVVLAYRPLKRPGSLENVSFSVANTDLAKAWALSTGYPLSRSKPEQE